MLQTLSDLVRHSTGLPPHVQARILVSLGVLAGLLLFQHFLLLTLTRRMKDAAARYGVRRTAGYVTIALALIFIGRLWSESFAALSTFLGLVGGGVAIALRDFFLNLAGWLFIMARRPFAVGERIQLGEIKGDVIDQRLFHFTVMELGNWIDAEETTGRLLHIPNGQLFTKALANYDQGLRHIWNEVRVTFTYEGSLVDARALCEEILVKLAPPTQGLEKRLSELSSKWVLPVGTVKPQVFARGRENGVEFTLRYAVEPRRRRESENRIWEALLTALRERPDLGLAYPTTRIIRRGEKEAMDA